MLLRIMSLSMMYYQEFYKYFYVGIRGDYTEKVKNRLEMIAIGHRAGYYKEGTLGRNSGITDGFNEEESKTIYTDPEATIALLRQLSGNIESKSDAVENFAYYYTQLLFLDFPLGFNKLAHIASKIITEFDNAGWLEKLIYHRVKTLSNEGVENDVLAGSFSFYLDNENKLQLRRMNIYTEGNKKSIPSGEEIHNINTAINTLVAKYGLKAFDILELDREKIKELDCNGVGNGSENRILYNCPKTPNKPEEKKLTTPFIKPNLTTTTNITNTTIIEFASKDEIGQNTAKLVNGVVSKSGNYLSIIGGGSLLGMFGGLY